MKTRAVLSPRETVRAAKPCKFRYVKSVKELHVKAVRAIAKMTAQCALYVGALKIFGTP